MNPTDNAAYTWPALGYTHATDARILLRELAREGMTDEGVQAALRLCAGHATEDQRRALWTAVTDATYAIEHAGEYVESPGIVACAEQEIDDAFKAVGL